MVTLSVTRSRVAAVLRATADLLEAEGWHPERNSVIFAIDRAAGYVPGKGSVDAEEATLQAWDALVTQLDEELVVPWERDPRRTQTQVLHAIRSAAEAVSA
ncbi:DUF6197 family protein [Streptomyces triticiradicis]|uniref:Uncharacterized protein n=1 Tax=Streptomyces triticiradicis TaxID=2651189 RepID=A0A7J5D550_9ACTN|nr:hypothetical protein [Streptomyces triticiradicis]KAB1979267.1 hypothetical protein F8144_36495 [Streptomyces triticiradicis]